MSKLTMKKEVETVSLQHAFESFIKNVSLITYQMRQSVFMKNPFPILRRLYHLIARLILWMRITSTTLYFLQIDNLTVYYCP